MHALLNDLRITLRSLRRAPGFLGRSGRLVAAGALVGLGGAIFAAHLVQVELYEVRALDAPSFLFALTLLLLTALLARLLPALRAARVPPAQVLKSE